ncbi:MAG: M48 family metallopeptidase [Methylococcales bacterium]|nr:M48 family metallopeptidase [Methylococcales bacterium]
MKYSPSLPTKNENISDDRHPLVQLSILLVSLGGIFLIVFWLLIFFVDMAVKSISMENEAKIYSEIGKLWDYEFPVDPIKPELKILVDQLLACTEIPYPITTRIIDDDDVNALALPAGNILLFRGLFDSVHSENGLAFVIAHELGHFINQDHLRGMGRGAVLMALSIVFTGADSNISKFLTPTSQFAQAQHSQKAESLADQTALKILACHYGHVGGATEFFDWVKNTPKDSLQKLEKVSHYFSTHPQIEKRINALHKFSNTNDFSIGKVRTLADVLPKQAP